jgi:hypothetical protein
MFRLCTVIFRPTNKHLSVLLMKERLGIPRRYLLTLLASSRLRIQHIYGYGEEIALVWRCRSYLSAISLNCLFTYKILVSYIRIQNIMLSDNSHQYFTQTA